jgi:hypothetical protein
VARVPDELVAAGGPAVWLVAVGAHEGAPVAWLIDGVVDALEAVVRTRSHGGHGVRRIAMPVVGVGRGGYDGRRGEVIKHLLDTVRSFVESAEVDVVLVASNPSDYSAVQAARVDAVSSALPARDDKAEDLARMARSGRLALFMGAGTGVPAGLPSWDELLADLAGRAGLEDPDALAALGSLDSAEVLRRAVEDEESVNDAHHRRPNPLGWMVADVIRGRQRYALSHVLLAALDVDQTITTNFDRLYEKAVVEIGGEQPLVVLPQAGSRAFADWNGRRPWLLKLHGDVGHPESIVLDRRSFVRYDASRRPLGGVLQTTLLTKHLLVVGASMKDDNVIRLVHEVAELTSGAVSRTFGTILSLEDDPLRQRLWNPELAHLTFDNEEDDRTRSARDLEIFLDRVAMLAAPRARHLLDPRYAELLTSSEEKGLAETITDLAVRIAGLPPTAAREWSLVTEALNEFGVPIQSESDTGTILVPDIPVSEAAMWKFALTYDAYRRHGGFESVAETANTARHAYDDSAELPGSLDEARAALFFEQRRWRHFGSSPDARTLDYLQVLVGTISRLSGGRVEAESPTL